jgi:tRNA pseudouridine55 synthase
VRQNNPKRHVSGWLILDKPAGMTSTRAVGAVKRLFSAKKAGHAGTLDPLATGVLPIALGEATKTVPFVQDGAKTYRFDIVWGAATTTCDAEGEITETSDKRPSRAELEAVLKDFTGTITQVPPVYSAVKVGGRRAYELARAGETPHLPPREVNVHRLALIDHGTDRSSLEVECAKGTYARALARDIAEALGTRGHIGALRRLAVGEFGQTQAIPLAALEAAADPDSLLLPVAAALADVPRIAVDANQAAKIRLGNPVLILGRDAPAAQPVAAAYCRGLLVAIGRVEAGQFKPKRLIRDG